ncbi:MAG: Asp23/Gls24 family envelope stress response protein [Clostridia bacterium]|nr:Asp23/Gls24 family envelope stress response protein [Clostridia bacterium]MBQ2315757.1 Asp23/Gls24 family envelope stress response protein [Clostridia bacterium]MEE0808655.1 Asp23/Gls24 family envelope stress response protein [Acutalibacteraceae bacterium]
MIAYETRMGKIIITEEFLSKLIGHEVTSCFGVVGMAPSSNRQKIYGLISKNQALDTGIKVMGDADTINVELHIIVTYGMNINAIAASITEKVKYVVKETTGITVNRVIIKVDGIKE